METLTLTQREQARLQVLNSLLAGHMTMDQAATLMGVSIRHTRRILAAYREEGAAALSHGNRGLRATNATPETTKAEVLRLARSRYSETNHTHLSELLREREGIDIARTTLRRILAGAGLKSPRRRRPPQHRVRRQKMLRARDGMLIQWSTAATTCTVTALAYPWDTPGPDARAPTQFPSSDGRCLLAASTTLSSWHMPSTWRLVVNALFCDLVGAPSGEHPRLLGC